MHLLVAALAFIEAASQEAEMRRLEEEPLQLELVSARPRLRAALFAQAIADSSRGLEGALGAELSVESEACRYFVAGGQARLASRDGQTSSSAEQWASACLFSGFFHLELRHHLEWEVRPSFAAPRVYPRAPYSRERIGLIWRSLDFELDQGMRFVFGDVDVEMAVALAPAPVSGQSQMTVRMDFLRFVGPQGGSVDLFRVRVQDVFHGTDAFAMEFAPIALSNLRFFRDDVRFAAEAGFAAGVISLPTDDDPMTPPLTLVELMTFAARARLHGGTPWLAWQGGYVRSVFPTLDGALALEDRLTAAASHRRGPWTAGAEGFTAFTQLFTVRDHDAAFTAGVDLSAGRDLGHGLHAGAFAQLARTFYAELDGGDPTPTLAARALLVLSARIGR